MGCRPTSQERLAARRPASCAWNLLSKSFEIRLAPSRTFAQPFPCGEPEDLPLPSPVGAGSHRHRVCQNRGATGRTEPDVTGSIALTGTP